MAKIHSVEYLSSTGIVKRVELGKDFKTNALTSSIITGTNGSGKSSILREIVNGIFLSPFERSPSTQLIKIDVGNDKPLGINKSPSNLIAASGSLADRFPFKRHGSNSPISDNPRYVYLGQKVNTNLWSRKQSLEVISTYLFDMENKDKLSGSIFKELSALVGIQPDIEFEFVFPTGNTPVTSSLVLNDLWGSVGEIKDNLLDPSGKLKISRAKAEYLLLNFSPDQFYELSQFLKSNRKKRKPIKVRVADSVYSDQDLDLIRFAIMCDFIRLNDVRVRSRLHKSTYSIFELSSGEYHFFCNILGIYFASNNDSVILLDEPENSLHPKWQFEFMDLLFRSCTDVIKGHLIISTHSPIIVSSALEDTCIVDLSSDLDMDGQNYYGASVDSLLVDHFGVASTRNLYFIDLLQRTVDRFSRGDKEGVEYQEDLATLRKIQAKLKKNDPLVEVIDVLGGKL